MKMRIYLVMMLMSFLACGTAGAWGIPSLPTLGGGAAAGDPDAFLVKAKASETLVNASADCLFSLVASKEEQAKVEEQKKKIATITDAKEKNAQIQEARTSQLAVVNKAAADKALEAEAKNWDNKKKQLAADSLFNLALGGAMAAELVPQGQNLATSIKSNPALLFKANSIYEAVKSLGGIGMGTVNIMKVLPPVFSAANIDVKLPTSASDKPKQVEL